MAGFGPDKVVLPVGTNSDRPVNPGNGFMRYNTDQYGVEMYTQAGWMIGGGAPGSAANPATDTLQLVGQPTGNYWLQGSLGLVESYIKQDYGGGWINLNTQMGAYGNVLSTGWGSGGGNIISGASGTSTSIINASSVPSYQAYSYGCPGQNGKSYLNLDSTFASDFSISEVRIKIYMNSNAATICGPYWQNSASGINIISGTTLQIGGTCANGSDSYGARAGSGWTVEWYGTLNLATRLLESWSACGGGFDWTLKEIYVR